MAGEQQWPKYPAEFLLDFRSIDRFLFRVSDIYTQEDDAQPDVLSRLDDCDWR